MKFFLVVVNAKVQHYSDGFIVIPNTQIFPTDTFVILKMECGSLVLTFAELFLNTPIPKV